MISIVVISYNTKEMTLACLRSVFAETHLTDFELIVLDNASVDGSAAAIETEFGDQVQFISADENLGFAAGNNLAAQHAHGDHVLLLNPDTVVFDNAIDRLVEFASEYPEAGIWGGRTVYGDKTLNPGSCWSRQSLWSLVSQLMGLSSVFRKTTFCNPEGIGSWDRRGIRHVDIVSGCFLLIRRDLWVALAGFREEFFMYGEDADLCLRAQQVGAKPLVTGLATIVHHGGASESVHSEKLIRLLKAKMLLISRHFPASTRKLGFSLLALWPLSRASAHSVFAAAGRHASSARCAVWREVWKRRCEWTNHQPRPE
ncbi:MAG: glycosyltransferase family 2 protein [Oleiphilaceae bacterium]|nr:glycosyltransferase family 2 protein [Oleiphilaceae bacterium]